MPIKAAMQALQRTDALKLALATLAAYCASKLPPNMQLVLLEPHGIVDSAAKRIAQTCHLLPDREALQLRATVRGSACGLAGLPQVMHDRVKHIMSHRLVHAFLSFQSHFTRTLTRSASSTHVAESSWSRLRVSSTDHSRARPAPRLASCAAAAAPSPIPA